MRVMQVTDFDGSQLDFARDGSNSVPLLFSPHGGGVVVTNRLVHNLVLEGLVAGLLRMEDDKAL